MTQALSLVQTTGQKAFTTSLIVANGCDNKSHESTTALIRKYARDFQELGILEVVDTCGKIHRFENGGNLTTSYYNLSEDQATYLVTLFRNTVGNVAHNKKPADRLKRVELLPQWD